MTHGCEQRSNPCARTAAKFIEEGGLGEVYLTKEICYKRRETIGKTADEPVPAGVHYDLWLGPASLRPFSHNRRANIVGNLVYGSKGYMAKTVARWQTYMGKELAPGASGSGEGDHYQAFVNAIRHGDPKTFNKGIEEAFYSCALVHLANISYRLGRSLDFDPVTQQFPHDDQANSMLRREYREPFVVPEKV